MGIAFMHVFSGVGIDKLRDRLTFHGYLRALRDILVIHIHQHWVGLLELCVIGVPIIGIVFHSYNPNLVVLYNANLFPLKLV